MRSRRRFAHNVGTIAAIAAGIPFITLVGAFASRPTWVASSVLAPSATSASNLRPRSSLHIATHSLREHGPEPEPLVGNAPLLGLPVPPTRELQELQDQQGERPAAKSPPPRRPPSLGRRPKVAEAE